jgi:hypothetical protein
MLTFETEMRNKKYAAEMFACFQVVNISFKFFHQRHQETAKLDFFKSSLLHMMRLSRFADDNGMKLMCA